VILVVAIFSFVAFLAVVLWMAVGVFFGRRSISGSCGGLANQRDEEGKVACGLCENPADACRELRSQMAGEEASATEEPTSEATPTP
jgi:hypothetical protein